jgi:very-short-patch-repair endonuclease
MGYYCNKCNKKISEEMYKFSKDNFSRALCMEHQPKSTTKVSYQRKPEPTQQALKLGNLLKNMGHKVEFEKYDGYKHIDIAIVKSKVNIEVDGGQHHGKTQALRDLKRTFYSWDKNFVTLRIPNSLTEDDTILRETAEYIDKFLKKGRTQQLEKEIREEYVEEGNPIWEDVTNFVNGMNNIISSVGNVLGNLSKNFSLYD